MSTIEGAIIDEVRSNLWGIRQLADESQDNLKEYFDLPFHLIKRIVYSPMEHLDLLAPVKTKDRLIAFQLWMSRNNISADERKEIVENFDLETFSVEELMTIVKSSGLFPLNVIDKRVLYLVKDYKLKIEKLRSVMKDIVDCIPEEKLWTIENLIGLISI